jgi:protein-tyrosine phosphatase
MATRLHWVDGPWPGKLALAARPRGGDWLTDEIAAWQREGVETVFSLLTPLEEQELDLTAEAAVTQSHGLDFISFPIPDREVPTSEVSLAQALNQVDRQLSTNRNVLVHCRQGVGRSGLIAACLLIGRGMDADTAITRLSAARGAPIPDTAEQRRWIDHYSELLATPQ